MIGRVPADCVPVDPVVPGARDVRHPAVRDEARGAGITRNFLIDYKLIRTTGINS
jgi:hypothetical protein